MFLGIQISYNSMKDFQAIDEGSLIEHLVQNMKLLQCFFKFFRSVLSAWIQIRIPNPDIECLTFFREYWGGQVPHPEPNIL